MTSILGVRHAQASFGKPEYDELSGLGRDQARLLGEWLAQHEPEGFAAVACGTMARHRDTLGAIRDAYVQLGRPLPEPLEIAGLDEYDHRAVLGSFTQLNPAHEAVRAADGGRGDPRALREFLRCALASWASGELDAHVREPWPAFRARVREGVRVLGRHAAGGSALLVTSGGVLAQLAQSALDLADAHACEMNLTVRNSAMCAFRAREGGVALVSWNELPHLAAPGLRALRTYY